MKTQTSSTCTIYPIVSALDKADEIIGKDRVWKAVNDRQKEYLPIFNSTRDEARLLKDIKSICSRNAEEINKFLAKEGFLIKLEPFKGSNDFGIASVLDILVEWQNNGLVKRLPSSPDKNIKVFPGVLLKEGVRFTTSPSHNNPIAVIETKSGDQVCMTIHDQLDGFPLLERTEQLRKNMRGIFDFESVHFPQVDLNQVVDISWLKKLWTIDENTCKYEIEQALQQTKFRMNEKGARAQSGVALGGIKCTSVRPAVLPLVIDQPFLIWIERVELKYPLFTGWISKKDWKTPKDISKK